MDFDHEDFLSNLSPEDERKMEIEAYKRVIARGAMTPEEAAKAYNITRADLKRIEAEAHATAST